MSSLDVFVPPAPSQWLIRAMTPVNRAVMLKGFLGLRGVCDIRTHRFSWGRTGAARRGLRRGQGDLHHAQPPGILHRLDARQGDFGAHLSARGFWATNGVVNGLGRLAQKFWLANNLIAQIPGNSEPAREHSVDWALKGNVVLLHAEGAVGWHGNYVAPLMPGAVEMANEALKRPPPILASRLSSRLSSGSWSSSATSSPNFSGNAPMLRAG